MRGYPFSRDRLAIGAPLPDPGAAMAAARTASGDSGDAAAAPRGRLAGSGLPWRAGTVVAAEVEKGAPQG